ncbi:MAG: tetratricopeptide repeat protein [Dysgonamonadaceae bacterium]|jgi:predicted Zn-dependent protease|nr:tetratricopeptide repeat protein [Dysgonamonadaceae bacterium]
MDKTTLYDFLKREEPLSATEIDEVNALMETYPYFQTARLLELKNLKPESDSADFAAKLAKTSLLCADRQKLFYLIKDKRYARFLEDARVAESSAKDRTEELLDTFLETVAEEEEKNVFPQTEQDIVLTDYLSYIGLGDAPSENLPEDAQPLKHHDIIDDFIEKAETSDIFTPLGIYVATHSPDSSENADKESKSDVFLTETLAHIYIKQQKYEQALSIIKQLSLNFPKKSVYFADQIRFLEYLIINEKNKKL